MNMMSAIPKNAQVLHLTVTRHWFDEIESGRKKEDFRAFKPFWMSRLLQTCDGTPIPVEDAKLFALDWNEFAIMHMLGMIAKREYDYVIVANGYGKKAPKMICKFKDIRITDYDEQTDLGTGRFFAIGIGEILKKENL